MNRLISSIFLTGCLWGIAFLSSPYSPSVVARVSTSTWLSSEQAIDTQTNIP